MNKALAKIIDGKLRPLITTKIIFGEGACQANSMIDGKLDRLLEKEYGEAYIEAREKYVEGTKKVTEKFAMALRDVMKDDEDEVKISDDEGSLSITLGETPYDKANGTVKINGTMFEGTTYYTWNYIAW